MKTPTVTAEEITAAALSEQKIREVAKTLSRKCRTCGKRLAPQFSYRFVTEEIETPTGPSLVSRHFVDGVRGYGYGATDLFCTLRCGFRYGVSAAKQFDRRQGVPETASPNFGK